MIGAKQRVVVLCDADNVEITKDGPRRQVNYPKLLREINTRELVRAIYYRPIKGFTRSDRETVSKAGFEIRLTAKNSDSWLITDAFAFATKYDVIVFIGGDGDLEPAISLLQAHGAKVEVWSWISCVSQRVKSIVDLFVPLRGSDLIIPAGGQR